MAAPYPAGGTGAHYGDNSIAEDVTDIIYQITPVDKPFTTMCEETTSDGIVHNWQVRSLTVRSHNAFPEGGSYILTGGMRLPTRATNLNQILEKEVRVSESEVAARHYAIGNLFNDQMQTKLAETGTDFEHALLRASLASGSATSVTRQMQGLIQAIVSNASTYTTHAITGTLNETSFNDMLQQCWDIGGEPKDVLVGGFLKRRISSFTGNSTKVFASDERRATNTLSLYDSDFGQVQVHLSRDIPKLGDAVLGSASLYSGYGILFADRTMTKIAYLRRFVMRPLPETADSQDGVIKGEACVEWGNPAGHFYSNLIL